ncbi:MAG: hypothetical protein IJW73_10000 [Candidatus Gastranaerophilales bacterium]|nr:hypothetical protein [Candidatus Gastranaerophilales bacterium]
MSLFNLSNQQVARKVSKTVYKNLYQDIIHKDGFGITDKFVTPEQTNAAIIDIYVPIPINNRFRMRGAATNGAWANTDNLPDATTGQRKHVLSKRFSIDILKRYDTNIAVSEDEVEGTNAANLDEGFEKICKDQIEQDIAININGYTFASQLYSYFMDSFGVEPTAVEIKKAIEFYTYDPANRTAAVRAFKLSNAKVSKGDSKLYAGYYPAEARQAFLFDTTFLVDLTDTAALNASDVAARMLAQGGMNAFTGEKKTVADYQSGYVGWLDGMPLYEVFQQVKDAMYYYLSLDETVNADVIALLEQLSAFIAPANATLRGLRPTSFKTVDDPDTQGVIIQPKVNMGVRCLSGNSLKAVFSGADFADATKALASVKTIRAALVGKFRLPNLSYDYDNLIGVDNSVTAHADGTMDEPVVEA